MDCVRCRYSSDSFVLPRGDHDASAGIGGTALGDFGLDTSSVQREIHDDGAVRLSEFEFARHGDSLMSQDNGRRLWCTVRDNGGLQLRVGSASSQVCLELTKDVHASTGSCDRGAQNQTIIVEEKKSVDKRYQWRSSTGLLQWTINGGNPKHGYAASEHGLSSYPAKDRAVHPKIIVKSPIFCNPTYISFDLTGGSGVGRHPRAKGFLGVVLTDVSTRQAVAYKTFDHAYQTPQIVKWTGIEAQVNDDVVGGVEDNTWFCIVLNFVKEVTPRIPGSAIIAVRWEISSTAPFSPTFTDSSSQHILTPSPGHAFGEVLFYLNTSRPACTVFDCTAAEWPIASSSILADFFAAE
eukprot:gene16251-24909_t